MSEKQCTKCGEVKPFSEYSKNSKNETTGLQPKCKACNSAYHKQNREKRKANMAKYYQRNTDKFAEYGQKRYQENKKEILAQCAEYRSKNKDKLRAYFKDYTKKNLDKINERNKVRKKTDPSFKVRCNLRSRLSFILKNEKKSDSTEKLLGCTYEEARQHLENQFADGMSWDNYGMYGWHIDHIIPCASFDMTDPEQQRKCFHYTNLQPLWAEDNLRKSDKLNYKQ